jgi:hypothetical protein
VGGLSINTNNLGESSVSPSPSHKIVSLMVPSSPRDYKLSPLGIMTGTISPLSPKGALRCGVI